MHDNYAWRPSRYTSKFTKHHRLAKERLVSLMGIRDANTVHQHHEPDAIHYSTAQRCRHLDPNVSPASGLNLESLTWQSSTQPLEHHAPHHSAPPNSKRCYVLIYYHLSRTVHYRTFLRL